MRSRRAVAKGSRRENLQVSPGTVTMRNMTLRSSIKWAYHVFDYQITGPDWLGSERYDIIAKAKGPATEEDMRPMMQALLAERFKLALHRQTKEVSAYVLVIAKGGPKFKESQGEGEPLLEPNQKTMSFSAKRVPLSFMTDKLSDLFRAPIVDMTGLTGKYEVTIDVAKYMADMQSHGDVPPDPTGSDFAGLTGRTGVEVGAEEDGGGFFGDRRRGKSAGGAVERSASACQPRAGSLAGGLIENPHAVG